MVTLHNLLALQHRRAIIPALQALPRDIAWQHGEGGSIYQGHHQHLVDMVTEYLVGLPQNSAAQRHLVSTLCAQNYSSLVLARQPGRDLQPVPLRRPGEARRGGRRPGRHGCRLPDGPCGEAGGSAGGKRSQPQQPTARILGFTMHAAAPIYPVPAKRGVGELAEATWPISYGVPQKCRGTPPVEHCSRGDPARSGLARYQPKLELDSKFPHTDTGFSWSYSH
jgi:hypothetical protein